MFALEGPVDSLIVAASNAGRTPDSRCGCAAATATCNPIAATTIFATLVMSAEIIRAVLPVRDLFTGGFHAEPHSRSCRVAPHYLRLHADSGTTFFVPNTLVQNLPDRTTEPVDDGPHGLSVSQARDEAAIHAAKMVPFAFTAALAG
jgi:hypothetical protein